MKHIFLRYIVMAFIFLEYASPAYAGQNAWHYQWSADQRFRGEYQDNLVFDNVHPENGDLFYLRTRLRFKSELESMASIKKLTFFIEGLDARSFGHRLSAPKTQQDTFDLSQCYLGAMDLFHTNVDVKIGRQGIKYGKCRLLAVPMWRNKVRSFDAGVAHYEKEMFWADVFFGQVVNYDDNNFNESSQDEQLYGAYGNIKLPKLNLGCDLYFFELKDDRTSTHKIRDTVGVRWFGGLPLDIHYDVEMPFQFGEEGDKDINAFAFHVDVSKQWKALRLKPKVTIAYNYASGDDDPNDNETNTFLPLYGTAHTPYGLIDFFRWQNMRSLDMTVKLFISDKLSLIPQINFFWLDSTHDYWYNCSGGKVWSTLPDKEVDSYVGEEVSLQLIYKVNKHLKCEAGYAHFFSEDYVTDRGASDDADLFYTQVVWTL